MSNTYHFPNSFHAMGAEFLSAHESRARIDLVASFKGGGA